MSIPSDIYADSGNRLPLIQRDKLPEEYRPVYDQTAGDPRSVVGLRGPGGIRLYSPKLAALSRPASQFLRFEQGLADRYAELAILVAARELDSQFEWAAHEPAARRAGLAGAAIEVVKHRQSPSTLDDPERTIIELGRQAMHDHRVTSETFARAHELFGTEVLINLVELMGRYMATAILLCTFDQQLPPGQEPQLPV